MKKSLLLISALTLLASGVAFADSGVTAYSDDQTTLDRINEFSKNLQLKVTNSKGEFVGAFIMAENGKPSEATALFLCGNNTGYYYADLDLANRVSAKVGGKKEIGFYNDEYEAVGTAKTVAKNSTAARLAVTVKVAFGGAEEDADYATFTTTFFVNVPLK